MAEVKQRKLHFERRRGRVLSERIKEEKGNEKGMKHASGEN
jgi:hypothetical protein